MVLYCRIPIFNVVLTFIDIHHLTFLIFGLALLSCAHVNAIHAGIFILVVSAILCPNGNLKLFTIHMTLIIIAVVIVIKMLYQTNIVPRLPEQNCTSSWKTETFMTVTSTWFGLTGESLTDHGGYYAILIVATLLNALHLSQKMYRIDNGLTIQTPDVSFSKITRDDANYSITNYSQFILNYGFYKLGLEVSLIGLAVTTGFRNDVFSLVYGILLILLLALPRHIAGLAWKLILLLMSVAAVFQYLSILFYLPSLCLGSPRSYPFSSREILQWMFITHSSIETSSWCMFKDIILLIIIRQQLNVFYIERAALSTYPGGVNDARKTNTLTRGNTDTTIHDYNYISMQRLNMVKSFLYTGLHYLTATVALLNGTLQGAVLSIGYLGPAFTLLWYGTDLYLWHRAKLHRRWTQFLIYSVLVIIMKSVMVSLSCVQEENDVYVRIGLILTGYTCGDSYLPYFEILGLICVLFQRRFFQSEYFLHLIDDAKAKKDREDFGAEILRDIKKKQLKEEVAKKILMLEKVKKEMADIKKHYKAMLQIEPKSHEIALRMGYYDMFQTDRTAKHSVDECVDLSDEQDASISLHSDRKSVSIEKEKLGALRLSYDTAYRTLRLVLTLTDDFILNRVIPRMNKRTYPHRLVAWAVSEETTNTRNSKVLQDESNTYNLEDSIKEFEEYERKEAEEHRNPYFLLAEAMWYLMINESDNICHLAVFILQGLAPSLISLPLPLMTLLWGCLTPRSTPTFWSTMIAYVGITMALRALLTVFDMNHDYIRTIIGAEVSVKTLVCDIILLTLLVAHKSRLKTLGLWDTKSREHHHITSPRESFAVVGKRVNPITSWKQHIKVVTKFFRKLSTPPDIVPADVYIYIFICDFFNVLFVFFGYEVFTPQEDVFNPYESMIQNEIPGSYVTTLIFLFLMMLLNRALYLRRAVVAKAIVHIILVLLLHTWLFVALPIITNKSFANQTWVNVFYITNCVAFLLSAYQIRSGFPPVVYGSFITRNYNYINYFTVKLLHILPFYMAFKMITDWMNTKTSLTVYQWFKMESMSVCVFQNKCLRRAERDYSSKRGEKYSEGYKLPLGCLFLLLLTGVLWFPLITFAILQLVSESAPPTTGNIALHLSQFENLYLNHIHENEIFRFNDQQFQELQKKFKMYQTVYNLFENYDSESAHYFNLKSPSDATWDIPQGRLTQLMQLLIKNSSLSFRVVWSFSMYEQGITFERLRGDGGTTPLTAVTRQSILKAFRTGTNVTINIFVNRFIIIHKDTHIYPFISATDPVNASYAEITMSLNFYKEQMWWDILGICAPNTTLSHRRCKPLHIYIFSAKRVPVIYKFISGRGIIGIYVSVVAVIWSIVRGQITNLYEGMIYRELPNVDAIHQLCKDISMVRANEEFKLEEDLYAKLLFLFRSPETLIKVTRFTREDLV